MSRCPRTGRVDHGTVSLRGPSCLFAVLTGLAPHGPPVPGDLQARPIRAEKLTSEDVWLSAASLQPFTGQFAPYRANVAAIVQYGHVVVTLPTTTRRPTLDFAQR